MAKTKPRFVDKFERKQRLAQRPRRNDEEEFNARLDWLNRMEAEDEARNVILDAIINQDPQ